MIEWREEKTALAVTPLARLAEGLPAPAARRLASLPGDGLAVVVAATARETVASHLGTERDERGGLLCGALYADTRGAVAAVAVRAAVPAVDFSSSGVSLRMETDVWDRARAALAPGEIVVGWYHSHPGLGAFFSGTDRRTQAAFFRHPFSLGWVIDPLRREEAWFAGEASAPLAAERILHLAP